jgi:two-component system sensor histidine kinase KdpD
MIPAETELRPKMEVKKNAQFQSGGAVHWVGGTALAIATTLVLTELHANSNTAGMVFLVLVVWLATQAGTGLSLWIAALCAVSFDFFFLPPYHTFLLAGAQQWVDMLSFVASSLVVSRLAERARRQKHQAEQRQADVERLYALSQEMMLYEDADRLIRELPHLIARVFALTGAVLYVSEKDRFYASTGDTPIGLRANLQAVAQELNPALVSFAGYHSIALMLGLRPVGALAWQPEALSREVAAAVSAQVSISVARFMAIENSARVEAAREAERLRTALIDSLTHELRTPLTSIRAAATTLLETGELDEAGRRDLVSIIDEEAERLDVLIGEAVEMAEIDANVVQVHTTPQHPRALLDQAVEESRTILASHKVTIRTEGAEGAGRNGPAQDESNEEPVGEPVEELVGDPPVWFDPQLLSRVLRHLLENVAAYTPPGSRVILTSRRAGDRLEFCVEDNGPGIDPVDLPLVFEKFYRGKRGAHSRKGSGMGLAIVRAILIVHGGGIEAANGPGGGARFRFWVPLVEKEPRDTVAPQEEQAAQGSLREVKHVSSSGSDLPPL